MEKGHKGFAQGYWDENYNEPETMDGICNAAEHALYSHTLFDLEAVSISSIVDLGFGTGHMLQAFCKEFSPYKVTGIEPSEYVFNKVKPSKICPIENATLELYNEDILAWCKRKHKREKRFDLGICTSVFQYLTDAEIRQALPVLSERCRYLYFSVPTDIELDIQITEVGFHDKYAKRRTQKKYMNLLKNHFTIVSSRLLESKLYHSEKDSPFSELLFRF